MTRVKVRIVYRSRIAKILGVGGITLYPYILISGDYDEVLMNHEFIHIAQVRRDGWLRFYAGYLWDWVRLSVRLNKHAYFELPAEIEAFSSQRLVRHPALNETRTREV